MNKKILLTTFVLLLMAAFVLAGSPQIRDGALNLFPDGIQTTNLEATIINGTNITLDSPDNKSVIVAEGDKICIEPTCAHYSVYNGSHRIDT